MEPSLKSTLRRAHDPAFVQHYFSGIGLDLGADAAGLARCSGLFPRVVRVVPWRGELMSVPGVEPRSFDFVHASHCLQTVENPAKTVGRWLDLLKPGGYLVLTVPDGDLAPQGAGTDDANPAQRSSFTICNDPAGVPGRVSLLELVQSLGGVGACERISRIRDHHVDRVTARSDASESLAEDAIELVMRKRAVPMPQEIFAAAERARNAEDCLRICHEALRLYPYRFDVAHQASFCMLRWNLADEIGMLWDQAVKRLPDEWGPRLYQFLHTIASGKIQEGFRQRSDAVRNWPWQRRAKAEPPTAFPAWTGQPLAGKSIAIWSEFGLGDEIFFFRFARMLRWKAGASKVTVVCQKPLVELFEASGEADAVVDIAASASIPVHDYWVYPHDILAYLPVALDALPPSVPYLRLPANSERFDLPGRDGALKVGVVFKGAPTHENDKARSLPSLSLLDPLLDHEEIDFFSLQKGNGAEEAAACALQRSNFYDIGASLDTMMDTARAIAALDLVLTVDTSVAHVAGAMGKPTWLMLPAFADWRWHFVRDDSPWYPTMQLFRHPAGGSWSEVVTRVNGHLLARIMARSRPLKTE